MVISKNIHSSVSIIVLPLAVLFTCAVNLHAQVLGTPEQNPEVKAAGSPFVEIGNKSLFATREKHNTRKDDSSQTALEKRDTGNRRTSLKVRPAPRSANYDPSGQPTTAPDIVKSHPARIEDTVREAARLIDSLNVLRQQIDQLYAILESVDRSTYYYTNLRAWRIRDAEFQDSLRTAVVRVTMDSNLVKEKSDIQVIATPPPTTTLVALFFGDNEMRGKRLKEVLEADVNRELGLTRRILATAQYGQDKELIDRRFRIENQLQPRLVTDSDSILIAFNRYSLEGVDHETATVVTLRFLDNASIRFGSDWGAEAKIGNEELGYPFWTSGNMSFLVLYKRIKLGVQLPFAGGLDGISLFNPILKPRRLNGLYGVTGEFDVASAGGSFIIGLPRDDTDGTFADSKNIYAIPSMAQLWYSYTVGIANNADLMRFKVGIGFHTVSHDELVPAHTETVNGVVREVAAAIRRADGTRTFWSPYVKVEFMNQQFTNRFGVSVQYYKEWLLGTVWLEILRNSLRIEIKGAAPFLREAAPWEQQNFVNITIPYTFSFY